MSDMRLDEIAATYLQLRAKHDSIEAEMKEKLKPYKEKMEKFEGFLLKMFNDLGLDNVKTPNGTIYKSSRVSVSAADWETFFYDFVVPNQAWDMVERRPSKAAVVAYKEEHDALPPGVNWSEARTIHVRKSA